MNKTKLYVVYVVLCFLNVFFFKQNNNELETQIYEKKTQTKQNTNKTKHKKKHKEKCHSLDFMMIRRVFPNVWMK